LPPNRFPASIAALMKSLLLLLPLFLAGLIPTLADDAAAGSAAPEAVAAPAAPVDPAKEVEIRKMIKESGVAKTMKTVMDRMFDAFKAQNSSLSSDFWTRIESEAKIDALLEKLVPIYAKYYTIDDLKAINAFYESPAGRHMIQVQPQLSGDAMSVGQDWGRALAAKVQGEIQAEQGKTSAPAGK
jgi:hypothetical protein